MSQDDPQEIFNLCNNYLKSLQFQKSASFHTLQAYCIDLQQWLAPLQSKKTLLEIQGVGKSFRIEPKQALNHPQFIGLSFESLLLELTRIAQLNWATLQPKSRNRKASTLKSFFSWLYQNGYTERALNERVVAPKTPQKLPHFISVDEAICLIKTIKKETLLNPSEKNSRDLTLMLLLYGAGLRVSEACQLKIKDFELNQNRIRVLGKGNKQRLVAIPPLVVQHLKTIPKDQIWALSTRPPTPAMAYKIVKYWGRKAGLLLPLHPHALRHSYATHLVNGGINLRVLQKLMGHENLNATERYIHLNIQQLAEMLDKNHPIALEKK